MPAREHLDPADGRAGRRAPGGDQGPHRRRRHAHHRGLSGAGRDRRARRPGRRLHGAAAGGRRRHRRQDQPARAGVRRHGREPALRHAGQPVRPRVHPRRQLQRQRRRAGRRRGRHRHRQRHGRLDPQPVGVLRHRRPQDDLGPHPARGRVAAGSVARHARPDGARRRRHHRRDGAARARVRRRPTEPPPVIGRVRLPDVDPAIDAAVDAALAASELEVVDDRAARLGRRQRRGLGGDVPRVLVGRPPPLRARPGRARATTSSSASSRVATSPSPTYEAGSRPPGRVAAPSWRRPSTAPRCWRGRPSPCSRRRSTARCPTPVAPTSPSTTPATRAWPSRSPPAAASPPASSSSAPTTARTLLCATGLVVEAAARTFG